MNSSTTRRFRSCSLSYPKQSSAERERRRGGSVRPLPIQEGDEIVWFWIGSHADYDKMVAQQ